MGRTDRRNANDITRVDSYETFRVKYDRRRVASPVVRQFDNGLPIRATVNSARVALAPHAENGAR